MDVGVILKHIAAEGIQQAQGRLPKKREPVKAAVQQREGGQGDQRHLQHEEKGHGGQDGVPGNQQEKEQIHRRKEGAAARYAGHVDSQSGVPAKEEGAFPMENIVQMIILGNELIRQIKVRNAALSKGEHAPDGENHAKKRHGDQRRQGESPPRPTVLPLFHPPVSPFLFQSSYNSQYSIEKADRKERNRSKRRGGQRIGPAFHETAHNAAVEALWARRLPFRRLRKTAAEETQQSLCRSKTAEA